MATAAVFLALGGVSYAAVAIPKTASVTQQLKPNAVTTKKVKTGRCWRLISGAASSRAAPPGRQAQRARPVLKDLQGPQGQPGTPGMPGISNYHVVINERNYCSGGNPDEQQCGLSG